MTRPAQLASLLLICAGFFFAGCTAPRRAAYPVGIYGAPASSFPELQEAGFNTVVAEPVKANLDAARQAGLKVLAFGNGDSRFDPFSISPAISALDSHPALYAWYFIDEPDRHKIGPEVVRWGERQVKARARKDTVLAVSAGAQAARYKDFCDHLLVDFYPVPWAPVARFGREMHAAHTGAGPAGYIAVLQAFDWAAFPEFVKTDAVLRPPDVRELRCMAYLALAEQARGLFFYAYAARDWRLAESPLWPGVKEIVAEVRARGPLFEGLVRCESSGTVASRGAVLSFITVRQGNEAVPRGRYLLAINPRPLASSLELQLPFQNALVDVLGENRTLDVAEGRLTDTFDPFDVHVYGPLPIIDR